MKLILDRFRSSSFLMITLFLQLIFFVSILFDIPIVRQVVGFVFVTFFPGFIVIRLLKLNDLERLETVLFSVGFSIAFLMLAGLLANQFGSGSLSLIPLLVILNSFILVGGIFTCLRDSTSARVVELRRIETPKVSLTGLLFVSLPILSILGAMWVNAFGNNLALLFLIMAISTLFVVVIISRKSLPPKLYSLAVIMIAIALLFHAALISRYLVSFGSDNLGELFVFGITKKSANWNATMGGVIGYGRFFSMLSITILPTYFSDLLNIDPTWVLKALFPLIFSFVPLGLYQMWKMRVGEKYALISAFLLMAQTTFYYEMLGLNRQMIAELFFVLLLLVILNKKMKTPARILCFVIFSFALVTSHYGLSEIFLFFISLTLISLIVFKRPSRGLTVSMVVFFFVLMFTWYIYISGHATFDSIVDFGTYVYDQLGEFSNVESRGEVVKMGVGLAERPLTTLSKISRAFAYTVEGLIVVGFVGLIMKRVKSHIEREYFALIFIAVAFLAALILVPGLANTMNMTRFFHILLFFLSPLCILGAETLVKLISKRRTELLVSILVLMVLVPYFLFQTSFIYEVAEERWRTCNVPLGQSTSWSVSLPLSKNRMSAVFLRVYMGDFDDSEVVGAMWMSRNIYVENSTTYADVGSIPLLKGYGLIHNVGVLTNVTITPNNSNIYLNRANLVKGVAVVREDYIWNTTRSMSHVLGIANLVYSNGGCEIYSK